MDPRFDPQLALPRTARDFQLSPSKSAKDANGLLSWLVATTDAAQSDAAMTVFGDVPYGPAARQKLDVYCPKAPSAALRGAVIFLHGGFWQEGDKSVSGFAALPLAEQGWATIAVGYTLTPQVSLTALTGEIHAAMQYIAAHARDWGIDPERLVLAGHSAGGHLAGSVICDLLGTGAHRLICGAVLISGVFELAPIAQSYVNDLACITPAEVAALSPLRHPVAGSLPIHILIGADEPEAFQVQSAVLHDTWRADMPALTFHSAAGRDHFDVLKELCDPGSETLLAIGRMIQTRA